jgi:membrane protein YqaA with SNARE-associated domain
MNMGKVEMSENDSANENEGFLDLLKTSWVKSSIKWGIILAAIGLAALFLLKIFNVGNAQFFSNVEALALEYGLLGIFLATILAGTVVPLGSPALVVAAALFGIPRIPLILVATIGFTIGMSINYGLACRLGRPYVERKVSPEKFKDVMRLWGRWGWILYVTFGLIPVLPVELLAFICGLLKTRLDVFLGLSFVPRLIVFTVLAYFGETIGGWIGIV